MRIPSRTSRALVPVAALVLGLVLTTAAGAQEDVQLEMRASVDGADLARADANRPVELRGDEPATVEVIVNNEGAEEQIVRSVRISGRVLGLTFFSYETRVDMRVPPGGSDARNYALDLVDLAGQATGLLPAELAILDNERRVLAVQPFTTDVQGSLRSIYGLFGIAIAGITAVLLAGTIVRLARQRLSLNRWKRGVRFATVGVGIGLTLTFSLSALRVLSPSPSRWLTLVILSTATMFAMGYLTPTPRGRREEIDDETVDLRRVSTQPRRRPKAASLLSTERRARRSRS